MVGCLAALPSSLLNSPTHSFSHSLTISPTHSLSYSHTHYLTHSLTLILSHYLTLTLTISTTHSLAHSLYHSHTLPHLLIRSHSHPHFLTIWFKPNVRVMGSRDYRIKMHSAFKFSACSVQPLCSLCSHSVQPPYTARGPALAMSVCHAAQPGPQCPQQ